jgi:CheY-like chemotaxis protein
MLRILVIEDLKTHQTQMRRTLHHAGVGVIIADTALDGLEVAKRLLNRSGPPQIDAIALDWMLPHPRSESLQGGVVVAELVRAMDQSEIHPVHIVVVTHNPTPEREQDARYLGCSAIFAKPFTDGDAEKLKEIVSQALDYPVSTQRRQVYERALRFGQPALDFLASETYHTATFYWTSKNIKSVLVASSLYSLEEPARSWVKRYGGVEAVHRLLQAMPIDTNMLAILRDQYLAQPGENWEFYAIQLHVARPTYFEYQIKLFGMFAAYLNQLDRDGARAGMSIPPLSPDGSRPPQYQP